MEPFLLSAKVTESQQIRRIFTAYIPFVNNLQFRQQKFIDCLDESIPSCSEGEWLSEYSFVVLEHGMMDKQCGICPEHGYEHLANTLNGKTTQG